MRDVQAKDVSGRVMLGSLERMAGALTVANRTKEETGMMKKKRAMLHARMRAIWTAWLASWDLIFLSALAMASSHPVCTLD